MNSITEASKLNITFGPSAGPTYPVFIYREFFDIDELAAHKYDYEETKNRKCQHCMCIDQSYNASQTNIWYFYVNLQVWFIILATIIVFAFV